MSRVPSPLKTKTFVQFSKCHPKQHEEQNIECHFLQAKLLGQQQMHLLAWSEAYYVTSHSTRDQERTKPKLSGLWKSLSIVLWHTVLERKDPGDLRKAGWKCMCQAKTKARLHNVATGGAAGPGGTRLCLSTHVINSCPHSKHFLKGRLSVSIYL